MNPFSIIWMVVFAFYCSCQDEFSTTTVNTDSADVFRCDTYLHARTHEIAYTWAIGNFSRYETNATSHIFSPKLQSPTDNRYAFDIKVIPNGIDEKNESISLSVFLCDIRELCTDTKISIINRNNETLHSVSKIGAKIGGSNGPISWTLCKKDDLFRNQMLQNDTLTLSINIKWLRNPTYDTIDEVSRHNRVNTTYPDTFKPTIIECNLLENLEWILESPKVVDMVFSTNGTVCRLDKNTVDIQVHEIKYIWAIHNFSIHETLGYREIFSPKIYAPTTNRNAWSMKITPNGHHSFYFRSTSSPIGLDLYLSTASKTFAKYEISVINHEKRVLTQEKSSTVEKFEAGKGKYWQYFCRKTDVFREKYLNNDTLTLFINIKWISEPCTSNVSHQRNTSSPAPTPEPIDVKCNLTQIMESMLENAKFADVALTTTNGSSYPAHKNILAARSPVFAAMFQEKYAKHGNKSKNIRINVAPLDEEALRAMLRYIYTGKCENVNELADKLFVAAVKYGLDELRNTCEQTLCKNVTAENAASLLEFAKQHHADELQSKAMEFVQNVPDQKSNNTIH